MKKHISIILCAALALAALTACGSTAAPTPTAEPVQTAEPTPEATPEPTAEPTPTPTPEPTPESVTDQLVQMTLEEKVGQLFIIRPDALDLTQTPEQIKDPYAEGVTELSSAMADVLYKYPVGGIALFGKNISTPQQMSGFIDALQNAGGIPPG